MAAKKKKKRQRGKSIEERRPSLEEARFGHNLRRICDEKEFTIIGLAKKTGLARSTLYRYLTTDRTPIYRNMEKMARALRVPISDLFAPMSHEKPHDVKNDRELKLLVAFRKLTTVGQERVLHSTNNEVSWLKRKRG